MITANTLWSPAEQGGSLCERSTLISTAAPSEAWATEPGLHRMTHCLT